MTGLLFDQLQRQSKLIALNTKTNYSKLYVSYIFTSNNSSYINQMKMIFDSQQTNKSPKRTIYQHKQVFFLSLP